MNLDELVRETILESIKKIWHIFLIPIFIWVNSHGFAIFFISQNLLHIDELKRKQMSAKRCRMTIKTMYSRKWVHLIAHRIGTSWGVCFFFPSQFNELLFFSHVFKVESQWATILIPSEIPNLWKSFVTSDFLTFSPTQLIVGTIIHFMFWSFNLCFVVVATILFTVYLRQSVSFSRFLDTFDSAIRLQVQ